MKKILLFLGLAALIGGFIGYRMWNKPHQNMAAAKTDVTIDAVALFGEFEANEAAANGKYLDKIIALSGIVKNVATEGSTVVYLEAGSVDNEVSAELDGEAKPASRTDFKPGEKASFKCTCVGKNMFTLELKRCVEIR